jgi:hypothetical protein
MHHPPMSIGVSRRRRALGRGGTRPDSLIVVMNCGHAWGLRDRVYVVLSDCSLARCKFIQITATLSEMIDSCLLLSFRSNSTSIMFNLAYEDDVDYFIGQRVA